MRVTANIKPNAKHHESIEELAPKELVIRVKAPALEGKANQRTIELLAKHYGVVKSKIRLVRGASSKYKVFEVVE